MRKFFTLSLSVVTALAIVAGCGNSGSNNAAGTVKPDAAATGSTAPVKEKKVLKILQLKVEIVDALKKMAVEYNKEHPNVELEIMSTSTDYDTILKTAFASGNEPDIFTSNGDAHAVLWKDKYLDLTNEPWMKDMAEASKPSITIDGKIYGMAYDLEGFGYIYNKDLFAKAGITETPKTYTELEADCKKLQAAGITPFVNAYQETYILGKHGMNASYARQTDPVAWVNKISNGTESFVGNQPTMDYLKLIDLMVKYGNKNQLTTDYNSSVAEFAAGHAAIIQQGNWMQPLVDKINPNMHLGMFPMPINDNVDQNNNLFAFAGNYWVINKNSKVIPEAKEFLNWLVTSKTGQKYIVDEFKFIPAFKNIPFTTQQLGDLAGALTDYANKGLTKGRYYNMLPPGSDQQFGSTLQKYVAGELTKDQVLKSFDQTIKNLTKK